MPDRPSFSRLHIIWIALLGTIAVYAGIAWAVGPTAPQDPELVRWLGIFAAVAAGIQILTALLLKQMIAGVAAGNYASYCIVRWALVEAIGVYGLLLRILGASWIWAGSFLLLALVLIAGLPPSEDDRQAFLDSQ